MNSRKITSLQTCDWLKITKHFARSKKNYFIFCIYKMYLISAEEYKNAGVRILITKKSWQNVGKHEKCTRWFGC